MNSVFVLLQNFYDQVNTILIVIAILLAALGFFGFAVIREIVRNEFNTQKSKVMNEIKSEIAMNEAVSFWQNSPESAISNTEQALSHLTGKSLVQAKSNLAYYYAAGPNYPDIPRDTPYLESRERALRLAGESLNGGFLFPELMTNFKINYGYVLMRYAQSQHELDKAQQYFDTLLHRPSLNNEEITEINNYIGELRTNRLISSS